MREEKLLFRVGVMHHTHQSRSIQNMTLVVKRHSGGKIESSPQPWRVCHDGDEHKMPLPILRRLKSIQRILYFPVVTCRGNLRDDLVFPINQVDLGHVLPLRVGVDQLPAIQDVEKLPIEPLHQDIFGLQIACAVHASAGNQGGKRIVDCVVIPTHRCDIHILTTLFVHS